MHDFSCKFAIHHFRFFAKFSKRADKNSLFISEIGISGVENLIGSQIEIRSRPLPNCHHILDLSGIPNESKYFPTSSIRQLLKFAPSASNSIGLSLLMTSFRSGKISEKIRLCKYP